MGEEVLLLSPQLFLGQVCSKNARPQPSQQHTWMMKHTRLSWELCLPSVTPINKHNKHSNDSIVTRQVLNAIPAQDKDVKGTAHLSTLIYTLAICRKTPEIRPWAFPSVLWEMIILRYLQEPTGTAGRHCDNSVPCLQTPKVTGSPNFVRKRLGKRKNGKHTMRTAKIKRKRRPVGLILTFNDVYCESFNLFYCIFIPGLAKVDLFFRLDMYGCTNVKLSPRL